MNYYRNAEVDSCAHLTRMEADIGYVASRCPSVTIVRKTNSVEAV